ncbi:MAG: O-antigen ligase family protein, partial [Chloroflexota bacterium]
MSTTSRRRRASRPTQGSREAFLSTATDIPGADVFSIALLWGIRVALGLLLLTPLIVTTETVFPFIVGKALWSRALIEIILGLWIVLAIRRPEYRGHSSWLVLILATYLATVLLSGAFGVSFNRTLWSNYERMQGFVALTHWLALATVLLFSMRQMREWRLLISAHLLVGVAVALLGLAERFDVQVVGYLQDEARVSGSFGNPIFLAGYTMTNVLLALSMLAETLRLPVRERQSTNIRTWQAFYVAVALLSVWALFETGTRGSAAGLLVGLAVAGGLYVAFAGGRRARQAVLFSGTAFVLLVLAVFLTRDTGPMQRLADSNPLLDRVINTGREGGSETQRLAGIRIATQAFMERPVTGWGEENFLVPYFRFLRESDGVPEGVPPLDRAHNQPLNVLATTGVIGFVAYAAMWGWVATLAFRRVRSEPDRRLTNTLAAGALAALFIHDLFLFNTASTVMLFVFLLAWAGMAETRPDEPDEAPVPRFRDPRVRQAVSYGLPALVGVLVVAGVVFMNWRAYQAATLFTARASGPTEIASNLDVFPPLETFGQRRLLNMVADQWEGFPEDARLEMIALMDAEARDAVATEPQNMLVRLSAAAFYRAAAIDRPELLEEARRHTEKARELGPEMRATEEAMRLQREAE